MAPIPRDVATGTVVEVPGDVMYEVPRIFPIGDVDWAWIGGTMEVVAWSPPTYEIHLRDGQTCEFRDFAVDVATCLPDAGVLTFDALPGDQDLELEVGSAVGSGDRWPAPGGGFLCDTLHPPPSDDTSDTGTN